LVLVVTFLTMIAMSRYARAAATTVLCFGDSWTYGNGMGLAEQLRKHGHNNVEVVTKDYWGSTAEYFAKNPELLPGAVSTHKADYVLMSMGGNDFKNIYWKKRQYVAPWTALTQIEENLRNVLDPLFKEHPDIKVVTYGYDFPGSISEVLSGTFWDPSPKELTSSTKVLLMAYNTLGVRFINYSAMKLGDTLEKLSKEYSARGHSFTYVPLWGSLQKAAAPPSDKFAPSLGAPSPAEFMNDPIHANQKGYSVLLSELYESYFRHEILGARNVANSVPADPVVAVA